jgi:hypothetical protein
MTCHSRLFTKAEKLATVRQSLADGKPIRWTRACTGSPEPAATPL